MHLLINKQNNELPDWYSMTIEFVTGRTKTIDVASHNVITDIPYQIGERVQMRHLDIPLLEICTKDDIWINIPLSNIQYYELDKKFSKIVALKEKQRQSEKVKEK